MSHTQTVNLAKWQETGLQIIANTPEDQRKPVLMDEFNSASCGGIPESGMFGIALWSADYALQLAAVGYSGAYLHTRERGVTYNLFDPPDAPAGGPGWRGGSKGVERDVCSVCVVCLDAGRSSAPDLSAARACMGGRSSSLADDERRIAPFLRSDGGRLGSGAQYVSAACAVGNGTGPGA